ncbi:MAG: thioredoxin family protein [Candidatus Marinimicrobia bacterium]|nr:thioredoxin family protein [Candidatus Neomarinimicrobiota bacterium]MCF7839887.1 thioredoxin family protein [Candidatus Neomarinimicrobiota bacterium]MCF7902465.1 thioredoxin family protein [Candidatus Neomarinimicrobiota bacterium]
MQLTEFQATISQNELVLAYCSTPTCNVCQVLKPKVQELITTLGGWEFTYVNTVDSPEIAGQHLIFTVPTLLLFIQGREVKRFSRHFGVAELRVELERYLDLIGS